MSWATDFLNRRPKLPKGEEYGPVTRKIKKPKKPLGGYIPGQESPKKGVRYTTAGSERYRMAMNREAEKAIDKADYVRADKEEWMRKNYPKGIVD